VSIVLVNWNGKQDTLECLASLSDIDYPAFDVIVVDNGSADDSAEVIRRAYPGVALIETGKNLGFAGGNNVGIRYALSHGTDYLFLLNNDTVVDSEIVRQFLEARRTIGHEAILGAKIYYYSDRQRIWYAGAKWNRDILAFKHVGQGYVDDGRSFSSVEETDYACGCALFVSAKVLKEIGLLDETLFLNFEETDLCYRARRAGYASYVVPAATVWHKISTSFGGHGSPLYHYFLTRNKLHWARRHLSRADRLAVHKQLLHELLLDSTPPRPLLRRSEGESLRTALWRSCRGYRELWTIRYGDPVRRARLWGLRDYLLGRRGDCPAGVRTLATGARS
jgi:GT2 family glycosyltransferase